MKRSTNRTKRTSAPQFPAACTIVTRKRLSFARVLASSYLKHHPGARFYALFVDKLPDDVEAGHGIQVVAPGELYLPYLTELCFKYSADELCSALKPTLLTLLLNRYREQEVVYLDSDTFVMRRLDELIAALKTANTVLTPHLLKAPSLDGLRPDEQDVLTAGVYDPGFLAVRETDETHKFLRWWQARLRDRSLLEYSEGLFIDYRWLDLAPALFDTTLLKDETYNVSPWNIDSRPIEKTGRSYNVNGRPLATLHFKGMNPDNPTAFLRAPSRAEILSGTAVADLIQHYADLHRANGFETARQWQYSYDTFDNGVPVHPLWRQLYAALDPRKRVAMGDPFCVTGDNSFFAWATRSEQERGLSPFLKRIYDGRSDLRAEFPDVENRDRPAFLRWASTDGAAELGYDPDSMRICCAEKPPTPEPVAGARSFFEEPAPDVLGPKCSIIIPVYNKASLTRNCIDSLLSNASKSNDFEIIVADDASTDSTPELLKSYDRRVRVVSHKVNAGFAMSCNDGASAASGEYLVFLNNDTLSQAGWLDALVQYADKHPQAAAVGSKLLFPDDTIQHAGMVICEDREPRHIYTGFTADHPLVNKSRRFQVVTGGCLLVRREDFQRAQGFDLGYRNGYEDVDLCLRLGEFGREIHYCHESVLYHLEAVSRDVKAEEAPNRDLYLSRWGHRVRPDEFDYYCEDGLLKVDYRPLYPIGLSISPLLAVSNDAAGESQVDRVLTLRSRQVLSLLKDNISLKVRAQEAELKLEASGSLVEQRRYSNDVSSASSPRTVCTGHLRRLSNDSSNRIVSIILPVKNGASKLRDLLPAIMAQRTRDLIEIIAVDSGSEDESVDLLRTLDATVISIDPRSFNHGLTRNLATQYARGDFFVFMNQSTMPADEKWLANLVTPFDRDPALAAVCGRILPRTDADLLTARDIARNINASTKSVLTSISDWDDYHSLKKEELRRFVNFHTLSSAIRAEVFRKVPFRDATFAEDLIWGKEALEAGFRIQFEPSSIAFHSHNYSVLDTLRRNFDDAAVCRNIVGRTLAEYEVIPEVVRQVRDDWRYLENECHLHAHELEEWRLTSAMRRTAQWIGQWIGLNSAQEGGLLSLLSIVEQIKAGARPEAPETWRTRHAGAAR